MSKSCCTYLSLLLSAVIAAVLLLVAGTLPAGGNKLKKPTATPVELIKAKKDFKVELLYSVPRQTQGSWVSMCVDPKGRLITSDQDGRLYRVTPPALDGKPEDTRVEQLPVDLGEAQGLLWAFDSLYVVVNRSRKYDSGLWRVRSSQGNDILDTKEKLRGIDGNGEHGPHAVLLGPDGKSLYVLHGNHTRLVDVASSKVPRVWGEDYLVPRQWDASGHAVGILAPGGYICRVDPDGKNWQLVSIGYRNQYDAAFNRDGELFTYDSDMEWDINLPWYRPTRVCHAHDGSEFGWRSGTSNFPDYYPDNLPPVVDVGPGSPTGVCFGYGAKFPVKYQDALYLCDWSYGKLYAVHLKPKGCTYTGELEEFLNGSPLPLTDIVVNPKDGAMYFTIGGRQTMSGLYRVTYAGKESTEPGKEGANRATENQLEKNLDRARLAALGMTSSEAAAELERLLKDAAAPEEIGNLVIKKAVNGNVHVRDVATVKLVAVDNAKRRAIRKKLESYYGGENDPLAIENAWPYLSSHDRFLRYAARTVLEFQDPKTWKDKALQEKNPIALIHALIGLARVGDKAWQPAMLEALERVDWAKLTTSQKIDYLRTYQLVFIRLGAPDASWKERAGKRLEGFYPSKVREVNAELCKLVTYLETPNAIVKTMALLAKAPTQEEQIEYVFALRTVKSGWTRKQREDYLNWFFKAAGYRGGHSFEGFMRNIRNDAVKALSDTQKSELSALLAKVPQPVSPKFTYKERPLVKKWTVDELVPVVENGLAGRNFDRGRNLFGEIKCFACHRFNNEGGGTGPDLTIVSGRFGARDLLESIVEPSKVISDQYQAINVITNDGRVISGRIVNLQGEGIMINTDMLDPDKLTVVNRNNIDSIEPSKISMMPDSLIDGLNRDEILDLVAYLYSRGDRNHKMFRRE